MVYRFLQSGMQNARNFKILDAMILREQTLLVTPNKNVHALGTRGESVLFDTVNCCKFNSHSFYLPVFRFLSKVELTELIDEDKLLIRLGGTVSDKKN